MQELADKAAPEERDAGDEDQSDQDRHEVADLVLYFKHMMVLKGNAEYALHFMQTDALSGSQRGYIEGQFKLFNAWYANWSKLPGAASRQVA